MKPADIKWAAEQRFQSLEHQAFWHGGLNRADLTSRFGISVPQASNDLASYQRMFPNNLWYDHSQKRYFTTSDFKPHFMSLDADAFLANNVSRKGGNASDSVAEQYEMVAEMLPLPKRKIDPYALQPIVACTIRKQSIEILYQSMNAERPAPTWRRITPHSFGNDGLRWHTRAYCHLDMKFKDFILSRCIETRQPDQPGALREDDSIWNEFFEVALEPNPALTPNQQKIIADDFDMENGKAAISIRKALLYYFNKRLRLDVARLADSPGEAPVVVANKREFDAALQEATK